jgi:DNA-binding MarR family transcriptional regulator
LLQMQVPVPGETTKVLDDLIQASLPDRRGVGAWRAFLRAHASILRELAGDLATSTGLTLGDFDVLAQLAEAGGELRMTDLASRAFSSRSAMTRRIDRLVDEGLVGRGSSDADARGVVVELTEAGVRRLRETVPVHLRGVGRLFVDKLEPAELETLQRLLERLALDCSFG